jgi:hypothetical protein
MLSIEYSKAFDAGRDDLIDSFIDEVPTGYDDLLERTLCVINHHYPGSELDPDRIKRVNFGGYQGTLIFVIGGKGYQPWEHFIASVNYGSCSHCDAFQAADDSWDRWDDDGNERSPDRDDCAGYVRLCLHLLQSIKPIE